MTPRQNQSTWLSPAEPIRLNAVNRNRKSSPATNSTGQKNCRRNASICPRKISRTVNGEESSSSSAPLRWSGPNRRQASDATQNLSVVCKRIAVKTYVNSFNQSSRHRNAPQTQTQAPKPSALQTSVGDRKRGVQ